MPKLDRPYRAPPSLTVTPPARLLPVSDGAAEHTLVPDPRPRSTPRVAKLMHDLEVAIGERDQSKRERDQSKRVSEISLRRRYNSLRRMIKLNLSWVPSSKTINRFSPRT